MRDHLISTQDKKGHQAGSWMVNAPAHDVNAGGRLYVTALNCLTLEVYYRHLPLYGEHAVTAAPAISDAGHDAQP